MTKNPESAGEPESSNEAAGQGLETWDDLQIGFSGNPRAKLDDRGRLKMPAEFKAFIERKYGKDFNAFYITSRDGLDAEIYPMPEWQQHLGKVFKMPASHPARKNLLARYSLYGDRADMDPQGRLLIPEELRKSPDIWKQAAAKFNHCGELSKKAGMQFAYHNHWFEFLPVDGRLPYDALLKECDGNLVKMEMDLCWITAAGGDPLKYFNLYPGRFPLVHVKDLKKLPVITAGGSQNFGDTVDLTSVGSGIIDWKRIFAQSEKAGIKHYIVEHDKPEVPFDSITKSYEYLNKVRW